MSLIRVLIGSLVILLIILHMRLGLHQAPEDKLLVEALSNLLINDIGVLTLIAQVINDELEDGRVAIDEQAKYVVSGWKLSISKARLLPLM